MEPFLPIESWSGIYMKPDKVNQSINVCAYISECINEPLLDLPLKITN